MERGGTVYIMTNVLKSVLYTGVTSNLITRVQQHKSKFYAFSSTAKYNVIHLVYYRNFPSIEEAIAEENLTNENQGMQTIIETRFVTELSNTYSNDDQLLRCATTINHDLNPLP